MTDDMSFAMVTARRPCFFDIFSTNLSSMRLRVPVGFLKHIEGMKSGPVSLVGPSGNVWVVELVWKGDDDVYLDEGWSTFVRDHDIETGELLVFRYDGELEFTVQVFGLNACEKDSAFRSNCTQDRVKFISSVREKREREEDELGSGEFFDCAGKKARGASSEFNLDFEFDEEDIVDKLRQEDGFCHQTKPLRCLPVNPSAPFQSKMRNHKQGTSIRRRIAKEDKLSLHEKGQMSVFSEREKKVAQSFISCFPYFVRIMKRFNVSGSYTLNIPYQFSTAHLPNCKTEIVLRTIKGESWTVNSVPTTRVHTSHTFCGGWIAFVRHNDIKMGDVCIFELVRELELRVFILRVGKEGGENQSGKVAANGINEGSAAALHVVENFPKKSRKISVKKQAKSTKKVDTFDRKRSIKRQAAPLSRVEQGKHIQIEKNENAKTDSQAKADLRMMFTRDEKDAAKSFTSIFPNFVRIMRKFNISGSYTLKIPHQFSAAHLPNCKTEIVLRNLRGECWTVNSVPDSKGRTVHTFCGGWMAFVRDNDVKMGDVCMFELINKCEMRVHISGVGQQVQEPQYGKSTSNDLQLVVYANNGHPS